MGASRRTFLKTAVGVSGVLLAAACAPAPAAPPATTAPPKPTTPPVATSAPTVAAKPAAQATTAPAATAPAATAKPAAAPQQQPRVGGTLIHGSLEEPDRIWGPITGLTVSSEISRLVNASLVDVDDKLEFVPTLALEVPTAANGGISADGLTYTFKLRKDVRWHDKTPFTAKDVKFTDSVVMMPGVDVRGRVGWDAISEVITPDDYTVTYRLKEVYAPFLSTVGTVGILPEHVLKGLAADDINKHKWFREPMGLGPYRFAEWVQGDHLKLTRNTDYFQPGKPYIETIVFRIVQDINTVINMLERGEVHTFWRLDDAQVSVVEGLRNVKVVRSNALPPELLWMNHTRFPFDNKVVRQALAYGFDKEALTSKVLKGAVEPAWGLVSPLSWAYNPNTPKHKYDAAKASQMLTQDGWQKGSDGLLEKSGQKLSFELMLLKGEADTAQTVSFIQQQWRDLGVDAQIRVVDVGQMWGKALPTRDYQMAISYIGRPVDPDMAPLYLSAQYKPSANFAGYANPEMDDLLLKALQTVDDSKRKENYYKAQAIAAEDEVYLFLYWRTSHAVITNKLQGYKSSPSFAEYWNVADWWLEP